MNAGESQRAHHGEDGHRLRRTIDRGTPLLAEQKEHRRDQRTGVTDTDPEDEVDDGPGPANRVVVAVDTDTGGQQDVDGDQALDREEFAAAMVNYADAMNTDLHQLIDFMCVVTALGDVV